MQRSRRASGTPRRRQRKHPFPFYSSFSFVDTIISFFFPMFFGPGIWACGRGLIDTKFFLGGFLLQGGFFCIRLRGRKRGSIERRSIRNDWKWWVDWWSMGLVLSFFLHIQYPHSFPFLLLVDRFLPSFIGTLIVTWLCFLILGCVLEWCGGRELEGVVRHVCHGEFGDQMLPPSFVLI